MRPLRVLAGFTLLTAAALAGPPCQPDDPEPIDFQHYELHHLGQRRAPDAPASPRGFHRVGSAGKLLIALDRHHGAIRLADEESSAVSDHYQRERAAA